MNDHCALLELELTAEIRRAVTVLRPAAVRSLDASHVTIAASLGADLGGQRTATDEHIAADRERAVVDRDLTALDREESLAAGLPARLRSRACRRRSRANGS